MNKTVKKILRKLFIVVIAILAAYGLYKIYDYAIEVATERIRKGAEEGVSKGVGNIVNPLKWFKRK